MSLLLQQLGQFLLQLFAMQAASHDGAFAIDKGYAKSLANKQQALRTVTGTKKGIHLTFVTVDGVAHNSYWNDVQSEVTLDDLFK